MQYNAAQMHLEELLCCSYKFLIAAGRIDSRSALRHIQDGGCLFPSDTVIFGTRRFHTQGAWVHIAQSSWEPKQDEASFIKKTETDDGRDTRGGFLTGVSSINQRWTQLEVITQWDVRRRSWIKEFPILPRQCPTTCWLMTAASGTHNIQKTSGSCGWLCRGYTELEKIIAASSNILRCPWGRQLLHLSWSEASRCRK